MVGKVLSHHGRLLHQNSRTKFLNHTHILGRKSTKFQMNPMKDVGVAETSSWLVKSKAAWAITP